MTEKKAFLVEPLQDDAEELFDRCKCEVCQDALRLTEATNGLVKVLADSLGTRVFDKQKGRENLPPIGTLNQMVVLRVLLEHLVYLAVKNGGFSFPDIEAVMNFGIGHGINWLNSDLSDGTASLDMHQRRAVDGLRDMLMDRLFPGTRH